MQSISKIKSREITKIDLSYKITCQINIVSLALTNNRKQYLII